MIATRRLCRTKSGGVPECAACAGGIELRRLHLGSENVWDPQSDFKDIKDHRVLDAWMAKAFAILTARKSFRGGPFWMYWAQGSFSSPPT